MITNDIGFEFYGIDEDNLHRAHVETWIAGLGSKKYGGPEDRVIDFFVGDENGEKFKVIYDPMDPDELTQLATVIVFNNGFMNFIKRFIKLKINYWKHMRE